MPTALLLLAAVVAGWLVQLLLTYRQTQRFMAATRTLRARGTVSVGVAGNRYRGGRAYVAIAVDGDRVRDALGLKGFTTFAQARPVPELFGAKLRHLAGDREISGLTTAQRGAARQAAQLLQHAERRTADPATSTT